MADTKGIMLGHMIPFSPGNFLGTHNGAHPKMRQQVPEVEERWLLQEWQMGLWWLAHYEARPTMPQQVPEG